MTQEATVPDPGDWLIGVLRAFHPLHWILCLAGVVLTGLGATALRSFFVPAPADWFAWIEQPDELGRVWIADLLEGSLGALVRGFLLLAATVVLWSWIGAWIARAELLARRRRRAYFEKQPLEPSASALLAGRWGSLAANGLSVLIFAAILLVPILSAGWANEAAGDVGAMAVTLVLPVVLAADLVVLILAVGVIGWPWMAVTIAAECHDTFDALSRCYTYVLQQWVRALFLTAALVVGVSALPILFVRYPLAETLTNWEDHPRPGGLAAGGGAVGIDLLVAGNAGLSAPARGRRQHRLRRVGPRVSPGGQGDNARPGADQAKPPSPDRHRRGVLWQTTMALVAMLGSWCLTYWLFKWGGGMDTEWLGWGFSKTWAPPAEGLRQAASLLAGLWGVLWVGLPVAWAVPGSRWANRTGRRRDGLAGWGLRGSLRRGRPTVVADGSLQLTLEGRLAMELRL